MASTLRIFPRPATMASASLAVAGAIAFVAPAYGQGGREDISVQRTEISVRHTCNAESFDKKTGEKICLLRSKAKPDEFEIFYVDDNGNELPNKPHLWMADKDGFVSHAAVKNIVNGVSVTAQIDPQTNQAGVRFLAPIAINDPSAALGTAVILKLAQGTHFINSYMGYSDIDRPIVLVGYPGIVGNSASVDQLYIAQMLQGMYPPASQIVTAPFSPSAVLFAATPPTGQFTAPAPAAVVPPSPPVAQAPLPPPLPPEKPAAPIAPLPSPSTGPVECNGGTLYGVPFSYYSASGHPQGIDTHFTGANVKITELICSYKDLGPAVKVWYIDNRGWYHDEKGALLSHPKEMRIPPNPRGVKELSGFESSMLHHRAHHHKIITKPHDKMGSYAPNLGLDLYPPVVFVPSDLGSNPLDVAGLSIAPAATHTASSADPATLATLESAVAATGATASSPASVASATPIGDVAAPSIETSFDTASAATTNTASLQTETIAATTIAASVPVIVSEIQGVPAVQASSALPILNLRLPATTRKTVELLMAERGPWFKPLMHADVKGTSLNTAAVFKALYATHNDDAQKIVLPPTYNDQAKIGKFADAVMRRAKQFILAQLTPSSTENPSSASAKRKSSSVPAAVFPIILIFGSSASIASLKNRAHSLLAALTNAPATAGTLLKNVLAKGRNALSRVTEQIMLHPHILEPVTAAVSLGNLNSVPRSTVDDSWKQQTAKNFIDSGAKPVTGDSRAGNQAQILQLPKPEVYASRRELASAWAKARRAVTARNKAADDAAKAENEKALGQALEIMGDMFVRTRTDDAVYLFKAAQYLVNKGELDAGHMHKLLPAVMEADAAYGIRAAMRLAKRGFDCTEIVAANIGRIAADAALGKRAENFLKRHGAAAKTALAA